MFIVWGTKVFRRRVGRVADYCLVCREPRVCRFSEVRSVSHVYYIPLGFGRVVAHEIACETCKNTRLTDAARYAQISKDHRPEVDALIKQTNPGLYQEMVERIDREERAELGNLSLKERMQMIFEPLLAIAASVQARAASMHVDWRSGLTILALITFPCFMIMPGLDARASAGELTLMWAGIAIAAALLGLLIYLFATDARRFTRRKHGPGLIAALRPLRPTLQELQAALHELKLEKYAVGKVVKAQWLYDAIHSQICVACGYDLRGNVSGKCPECGASIKRSKGA